MLRTVFKSQTAFACLLIIYTAWIVSVFFRNLNGFDDFDVFFNSGKRLLNHENIYGEPYLNQLRYFYSPSFALLMSALQSIGLFYSKLIWYLINYFALMRMIFILKKYVFKHSEKPILTMFILLFISGKLTLFNFLSNQMTIVLIWIILESFDLINKGKSGKAMVLMAIGFNIKIIPLFALPWLIIISKKPLKSIFQFIFTNIILLILPALFFDFEYGIFLTQEWVKIINPFSKDHILQTSEAGFLDISAMITKYLCEIPVKNENPIHITHLPLETLIIIINSSRTILLSLCIWAALKIKGPIKGIDKSTFVLAGLMTLIPLCVPHQRYYSFLFALPMLAILLTWTINSRSSIYKIAIAISITFSGLMTWVDFTGVAIVDFFDLYRLTTIGMIILYLAYILSAVYFYKRAETHNGANSTHRDTKPQTKNFNLFDPHKLTLLPEVLRSNKN